MKDENAAQFTRARPVKFGRKKKGKAMIDALVRANEQAVWYRMQNLTGWDVLYGASLCILNAPTPATTQNNYPCYLWDLTAVNNIVSATQVLQPSMFRLVSSNNTASATYSWDSTAATGGCATGAVATTGGSSVNPGIWEYENTPASPTSNYLNHPIRRCFQNYVEGKFMLYGTTTKPVRWRIEIIRLAEDYMHPDMSGLSSAFGDISYIKQRNAFWNKYIMPWISNPINIQDPKTVQPIVVKTICDIVIEPKLSTEPSALVPHQVEKSFFYTQDRMLKYDWNDTSVAATDGFIGQQVNTDGSNIKTFVAPKYREYLSIRALCTTNNNTALPGTIAVATDPSFDFVLRKKITLLS